MRRNCKFGELSCEERAVLRRSRRRRGRRVPDSLLEEVVLRE